MGRSGGKVAVLRLAMYGLPGNLPRSLLLSLVFEDAGLRSVSAVEGATEAASKVLL